jgi:pyrroline-5-carboxylate reductase
MIALPTVDNPLLLFGCGNMGRALLDGWLAAEWDPAAFVVIDPKAAALPPGVKTVADRRYSLVLLAIKPQLFAELSDEIAACLTPDAVVLSVLAGTRIESLQAKLPGRTIIRMMPNLAAALGKSPIGLFPKADGLGALLNPLGQLFWLNDEAQMDAVTALAGSGPAFIYRFLEALAKAGTDLGLDDELAVGMAITMVEGAAALAAQSERSPRELAQRVTSPGGTTAAGLAILDDNEALHDLVGDTLRAAHDRGVELSKS